MATIRSTISEPVRSIRYLLSAAREAFVGSPGIDHGEFDDEYRKSGQPFWADDERLQLAMAVLLRNLPDTIPKALDVGCGDGTFSGRLAALCDEVTAIDFSGPGLGRVNRAVLPRNIEFKEMDFMRQQLPRGFNLVVAMEVLECFFRPWELRRACDRIISTLLDGGMLLVENSLQPNMNRWWSRFLPRGGGPIEALLKRRSDLSLLDSAENGRSIVSLFRRCRR